MKFLIDMNLSPQWIPFLVERGIEAIHWSDIGKPDAPDREIMEFAAVGGFIVFTSDLDFGTLLALQKSEGPSVIQLRSQEVLPSAVGDTVVTVARQFQTHLEEGALLTIDAFRQRIRLLPI